MIANPYRRSALSALTLLSIAFAAAAQDLETAVLEALAEQAYAPFPSTLDRRETENGAAIYELAVPTMAGAADTARITVFETEADAAASMPPPDNQSFQGYPSNHGSGDDFQADHYRRIRWLEWRVENRVFYVETQYHSTIPGEAADPAAVAETLMVIARETGLIAERSAAPHWNLYR